MLTLMLLLAVGGFAMAAIGKHNELVGLRQRVSRCRSEVIDAWTRRLDPLNRMLQIALHYQEYEKKVISDVNGAFATHGALPQVLIAVISPVNYPTLRANEQFLELMRQVGLYEQEAKQAIQAHNLAAENHNTAAQSFPWSLFWSSEESPMLDTTMEQDILPARWDQRNLRFSVSASDQRLA